MPKRLKFFIGHFFLSLIIACIAISIIFLLWYPSSLAKAAGVTDVFFIMLVVDVIIGPLLGLFIYKEGKKTLKFDLAVIILIQLSAFVYGFYSVAQGRPAWIVYSVDRFQLIRNNEIALLPNVKVKAEYQDTSWLGPQYAAVKLSDNKQQKERDLFNAVFGLTLAQQPNRYIPFKQARLDLVKNALNLNDLKNYNDHQKVESVLLKYPQANAWLPLKANALDMVVLINKNTAEVVKIVDLRPWK